MRNSIFASLLTLCLLLSSFPKIYAAEFADVHDHWAQDYIYQAIDSGLFKGVSEDRFAPDDTITRGMFITVLGRFEGIDIDYWSREDAPQFFKQDVDNADYYAAHIRWGVCNGIVNGINDFLFAPNRPITREQMAKLLSFYLDSMGHTLTTDLTDAEEVSFSDVDEIAPWAASSVNRLCSSGILTGYKEEDGSYTFRPRATATRAQCAAVFSRIADSIIRCSEPPISPETVSLSKTDLILPEGYSYRLFATTTPENAPLLWRSSDTSILTVDQEGMVTYVAPGYATVSVYTRNGLYDVCQVLCGDPEADNGQDDNNSSGDNSSDDNNNTDDGSDGDVPPNLPNSKMSREDKMLFLFGEVVKDPRLYYNGNQAATEADLVDVWVKAWDLKKNGEKYTRDWKLQVHKNLAETVKAIFDEIYNGPEKFPIHDMYCYAWVGKSEHTIGTAIDINYNENYFCDSNGNPITGSYWKPGEDPYSIPPGGDVDKAFSKYGYVWGINWTSGNKDYMHFSFFGT